MNRSAFGGYVATAFLAALVGCDRHGDRRAAGDPAAPPSAPQQEAAPLGGEVQEPEARAERGEVGAPEEIGEHVRSGLEDLGRATEELAERARRVAAEADRRAQEVGREVDEAASDAASRVAERLEGAARSAREGLRRTEAAGGEAASNVAAATQATTERLRDCDLSGPFSFFFEPGSAALRPEEANRAAQLNQCLARARQPAQLVVAGYGEMRTDAQSGVSLGLSRAHNIAQRVAMDGVVPRGVVLQTPPPLELPEADAAWGRRVEVRVRR